MRENAPPETARHVCHLNSDLSGSKRQEQNNPNAILRECCAPTKPCAAPCHTFHLWPQFWHTAKVRVLLPLRESAGMSKSKPQVHIASNIHIIEAKHPLFSVSPRPEPLHYGCRTLDKPVRSFRTKGPRLTFSPSRTTELVVFTHNTTELVRCQSL